MIEQAFIFLELALTVPIAYLWFFDIFFTVSSKIYEVPLYLYLPVALHSLLIIVLCLILNFCCAAARFYVVEYLNKN